MSDSAPDPEPAFDAGAAGGGAALADPPPAADFEPSGLEASAGRLASQLSNLFPLWVALASGLGLVHPPALAWFRAEYTTAALALTMLAMGTSLTLQVRTGSTDRQQDTQHAGLRHAVVPTLPELADAGLQCHDVRSMQDGAISNLVVCCCRILRRC